jgi:hypothetical protein
MDDLSDNYMDDMDDAGCDCVHVCIGFTDYSGGLFDMSMDGTTIRKRIC